MTKQEEMHPRLSEKISERVPAFWDLTPHYYQNAPTIDDIEKALYEISFGDGEKEKYQAAVQASKLRRSLRRCKRNIR
jgi:hypothetical protein